MPIVPGQEAAYRRKIRRRLTLDLFTRYGTLWTHIDALRDQWCVTPKVAVPPEPSFHTEVVGLMTQYQMPERFQMPDSLPFPATDPDELVRIAAEYDIEGMGAYVASLPRSERRLSVGMFLTGLAHVWKHEVARPRDPSGDWRNGSNVTGWMSWTPFLSACVLYDPPAYRLLDYAEHDDRNAAALPQLTFSQDGDAREEAGRHRQAVCAGDLYAAIRYRDALAMSFYQAANSPTPTGRRGRPSDALLNVQCAVW